MVRLQQYLIQEKLPLAVGDEDNIGKETAYRNTRLTGVTQGIVDVAAPPPGLAADLGEEDSFKEQITKIEEKMGKFFSSFYGFLWVNFCRWKWGIYKSGYKLEYIPLVFIFRSLHEFHMYIYFRLI